MPPDEKKSNVEKLLNQTAAESIRTEQRDTVSPIPADPDMVELSFESDACRYASDWLSANPTQISAAKPFALVLSRSIESDAPALQQVGIEGCATYQAFRSQKMIDVQGCVILTTMNLELAVVVPVSDVKNSQQLFDTITKIGIQGRQIAVFEPPKSNMILLPHGLSGASRSLMIMATGTRPPWKLVELEAEVSQFHEDYTRTPECILLPWSNAGKGVTADKLEIRISKSLAAYLDQKWKRGSVLAEYPSNSGRVDIFVNEHILEAKVGPCVVEVKVLRSRSTTKNMPANHAGRWAEKGVIQAHLYRQDKKAPSAYLYSFDARDKEEDLPEVDALAKKHAIEHRKFFMYRSTQALQDAVLAKAKG